MWTALVVQNRKCLLTGEDVKSKKKVWPSARELQTLLGDTVCLLRDHLPDRYNLGRQDWFRLMFSERFQFILAGKAWQNDFSLRRQSTWWKLAPMVVDQETETMVVPLENLTSQCLSLIICSASQAFPLKAQQPIKQSWELKDRLSTRWTRAGPFQKQTTAHIQAWLLPLRCQYAECGQK